LLLLPLGERLAVARGWRLERSEIGLEYADLLVAGLEVGEDRVFGAGVLERFRRGHVARDRLVVALAERDAPGLAGRRERARQGAHLGHELVRLVRDLIDEILKQRCGERPHLRDLLLEGLGLGLAGGELALELLAN